jgi:hypothetical protein
MEALLFWAGVKVGGSVFVTTCIYPKTLSAAVTSEVCPFAHHDPAFIQTYHLPLLELDAVAGAKVISESRKRGLRIIAQVHSHAGQLFTH